MANIHHNIGGKQILIPAPVGYNSFLSSSSYQGASKINGEVTNSAIGTSNEYYNQQRHHDKKAKYLNN